MTLPEFLAYFFDDADYASVWSISGMKDFAWYHLSEHSAITLSPKGERVSYPTQGCWIFEVGIFNPSLYSYNPTLRYYVSYYHDESHVYPVFCVDANGKSF